MPDEHTAPEWLQQCPIGQLTTLGFATSSTTVEAHVARGSVSGPMLAVLAGVHGDEYEGPVAIAEVLSELSLPDLSGTLIAIPISNPPAFSAGTRTSPLDGGNLARCFPGEPDGSPSERLAHLLTSEVIRYADAMIDLHSAGVFSKMALLVGFGDVGGDVGEKSREIAIAFGAPVIWEHPQVSPGRTISTALDLGIPCVYTEAAGGGGAPREFVECYREGILRVMHMLGMLPGDVPGPRHDAIWRGEGDTDAALSAPADGLFRPAVAVGAGVQEGEVIGEILGYDGQSRTQVTAAHDGVVVMVRRTPRVTTGERLYLLTSRVN